MDDIEEKIKYNSFDDLPDTLDGKLYMLLTKVRNKQLRGDGYFNNNQLEILAKQFIAQELDGINCGIDWTRI